MLKKVTLLVSLFSVMNYSSLEAQEIKQQFEPIKIDTSELRKVFADLSSSIKSNEFQNLIIAYIEAVKTGESSFFLGLIKKAYIEAVKSGETDIVTKAYYSIIPAFEKNERNNLLFLAVDNHRIEITSFFIKLGYNINEYSTFERPLIMVAADHWDAPMIELLAKNNANIEALYLQNWTSLSSSIYKLNEGSATSDMERCYEAVKMLIKYRAEVNAKLKDGSVPLHRAVSSCYVPLIELLLQNGANAFVNYRSDDYNSYSYKSPLYFAIINNKSDAEKVKAMDVLLKYGADFKVPVSNGKTFLELLINVNSEELLRAAIDKGLDIHFVDDGGRNTLWMAANNGKENSVKVLLEKGIDKNKKGKEYGEDKELTPLEIAKKNNYKNIIHLLEN
ncbi:MAG: ankyrin repeat domain-containing protein [Bacteroidales bacterium]|nr:MAG: ankyrin repeat domain-containing protein [Bacteroidales bacterium]